MQLSSSWVGSRQHLSGSCGKFWTLHIGKEDKHKIISRDGENGSYSELQPAPHPHTIVVTALEQELTCLHFNFKQIYQWIKIFAFSPPFWHLPWLCRLLKFEERHFKHLGNFWQKQTKPNIFMTINENVHRPRFWGTVGRGTNALISTSMTVETW